MTKSTIFNMAMVIVSKIFYDGRTDRQNQLLNPTLRMRSQGNNDHLLILATIIG